MFSKERLWNALALGGVLLALLATAGVVNLGELLHWPYLTMTSTSPVVTAQAPGDAGRIVTARPQQVEPQPRPAPGQISEVADDTRRDAIAHGPTEDDALAAGVTVPAPPVLPPSPSLSAPDDATTIPLHATLTTPEGPNPMLRAQDELKAILLTTTDAFAYCYYADGHGRISRIFPNRFQPDALIRSGALPLADGTGGFTIVADTPNRTEELRCMAATRDLGTSLPDVLKAADLAPLPVRSLNEISSMFQSLGEDVVETRLVAEVAP